MSEQSKIEERRQRALEVWYDSNNAIEGGDIDDAIETATRVKITREAIEVFRVAGDFELNALNQIDSGLTATLAELGFEVES